MFRGRLGPGEADDKSIRILNRVVQWTRDGIEYEADQRHSEIIVPELGLNGTSKSVSTPSVKSSTQSEDALASHEATLYRALVARANYLAQDRSDIGFVVKELCRHMSSPSKSDWDRLKRLGRYLAGRPRVITVL